MNASARVFSLLIIFFVVATTLGGIGSIFKVQPGEVLTTGGYIGAIVGAVMFPFLVSFPLVFTIAALGKVRPRLESMALILSKLYLFLICAAAIGSMLVNKEFPTSIWVIAGLPYLLCLILNVAALELQKKARVAHAG